MRYVFVAFLICLGMFACKKRPTKNPIPALEFRDFNAYQINGRDTAVLTFGYEDGDGDIFADNNSSANNLFITPYFFNDVSSKYEAKIDPITQDTFRRTVIVRQPANGYYRGKSIKGDVTVPLSEFRQNSTQRNFKYSIYMIDMSGNKSNIVATPAYSLNF